jgi:L-aminopeptidase/D-esterase-like protein
VTPSGYVVGALAAVNSFGSPYEEGTKRFLAAPYECNGEFGGRGAPCAGSFADMPTDTKLGGGQGRSNTTLCVIATDADLPAAALKRVAVMAQDGLARALRPAHGPTDGDIVFALSTATHPVERSLPAMMEIGNTAADTLARAIAKGVFEAEQG